MPEGEAAPAEQGGDNVPKEGTEGNPEDVKEGSEKKEETNSPLEEAKKVVAESRDVLKGLREENDRLERLQAETLLSGRANAGVESKAKTQDEKDTNGARALLKGTGYDEQLFPEA